MPQDRVGTLRYGGGRLLGLRTKRHADGVPSELPPRLRPKQQGRMLRIRRIRATTSLPRPITAAPSTLQVLVPLVPHKAPTAMAKILLLRAKPPRSAGLGRPKFVHRAATGTHWIVCIPETSPQENPMPQSSNNCELLIYPPLGAQRPFERWMRK